MGTLDEAVERLMAMSGDEEGYPDRIRIGQLSPGDTALLRDLAEAAAEKAVHKCMIAMGLDPGDPIKAQNDFGIMRHVGEKMRDPAFKADLDWARRARLRSEGIFGKIIITVAGLSAVGAMHAIWSGLKALVSSAPPLPPVH